MGTIGEVSKSIEEFFQKIPSLQSPTLAQFTLGELRDKKRLWAHHWANKFGIYLFFQKDQLQYIGRALSKTLAERIWNEETSHDPAWDAVIKDDDTTITVVSLNLEDAYWAASLETFLIARHPNLFNKRIS